MHRREMQFISKLGSGGYGEVHKAIMPGTQEYVAVKILHRANDEGVARFKREVKILSRLNHRNIIQVLAHQLNESPYSFVMPLADSSLATELPHLYSDNERIIDYFQQILAAISYAHSERVIHRDIKPQNILLKSGVIYVSDFGLGKRIESSELYDSFTQSGVRGGTIAYAAPEQMSNFRHATERADIYSLGKLLYQMLTNCEPFPSVNIAKVPDQYRYIVNRCVKDDPQDRFPSVVDLLEQFNEAADSNRPYQVDYTQSGLDALLGTVFTVENADAICRYFLERLEQENVMRRDFPKLTTPYLSHYVNVNLTDFKSILRAFDRCVSGSLDFSYCDIISNTYLQILQLTDDLDIFRLVATRLLILGASHNRFKVMDDFCDILGMVDTAERSKAMIIADIIKSNSDNFAVVDNVKSARLDSIQLPRIIRASIEHVRRQLQNRL